MHGLCMAEDPWGTQEMLMLRFTDENYKTSIFSPVYLGEWSNEGGRRVLDTDL